MEIIDWFFEEPRMYTSTALVLIGYILFKLEVWATKLRDRC